MYISIFADWWHIFGGQAAQALAGGNPREVLVYHKSSNIEMSRGHMACLKGLSWLNDEVMNIYMGMLLVHSCTTCPLGALPHSFCAFGGHSEYASVDG